MMYVRAFVLTQNFRGAGPNGRVLLEPLDGVEAPRRLPLSLKTGSAVAILDATEEHIGTDHEVRIEVELPGGDTFKTLPPGQISFTNQIGDLAICVVDYGIGGFVFREPGLHWFRLYLDGFPVARAPLIVTEAS